MEPVLVLRVARTGDFADVRVGDFAGVRTGDLARRGVAAVALAGVEDFAGVRGILRKGGKSERAFDNARPKQGGESSNGCLIFPPIADESEFRRLLL